MVGAACMNCQHRVRMEVVAVGETKEFATEDVLSAVIGHLVSERRMNAVYDVLGWMAGESLCTHQLVRVMKEAQPVMFARFPLLFGAFSDKERCTTENWREWRNQWVAEIGPTLSVPRLNEDQHERIDPLSEAAELFPPDRIITITV